MLQCHNIVNSKTLLLQFLIYVQETKYCAAGKQADILPDSKIINCKQTKLLFLIKISWLVFKRKGLKSYKFYSKTKKKRKNKCIIQNYFIIQKLFQKLYYFKILTSVCYQFMALCMARTYCTKHGHEKASRDFWSESEFYIGGDLVRLNIGPFAFILQFV